MIMSSTTTWKLLWIWRVWEQNPVKKIAKVTQIATANAAPSGTPSAAEPARKPTAVTKPPKTNPNMSK